MSRQILKIGAPNTRVLCRIIIFVFYLVATLALACGSVYICNQIIPGYRPWVLLLSFVMTMPSVMLLVERKPNHWVPQPIMPDNAIRLPRSEWLTLFLLVLLPCSAWIGTVALTITNLGWFSEANNVFLSVLGVIFVFVAAALLADYVHQIRTVNRWNDPSIKGIDEEWSSMGWSAKDY